MGRGELRVRPLWLLESTLTLHDLWRLYLRLLLAAVLTFVPLVRLSLRIVLLESPLAFVFLPLLLEDALALVFLPLLELLPGLLSLTVLTVTAGFFLQTLAFSPTLYP
jgi:hypothetical protein